MMAPLELITEDGLSVPAEPPPLVRQYAVAFDIGRDSISCDEDLWLENNKISEADCAIANNEIILSLKRYFEKEQIATKKYDDFLEDTDIVMPNVIKNECFSFYESQHENECIILAFELYKTMKKNATLSVDIEQMSKLIEAGVKELKCEKLSKLTIEQNIEKMIECQLIECEENVIFSLLDLDADCIKNEFVTYEILPFRCCAFDRFIAINDNNKKALF